MGNHKNKSVLIFCGLAVFLAALTVRLIFILNYTVPWVGDQPSLFTFSVNVMNGQYYGTNGAYWPPAFIFFSGFLFKIFGKPEIPDIGIVGVAQVILGALTGLLICLTAYKMFRHVVAAFAAGLFYAFLPTAILYTGFFYTETLWVFLVFLSIWLTYISLEKKKYIYYIITGISFGLSVLSRPTSLPLAFLTVILFSIYAFLDFIKGSKNIKRFKDIKITEFFPCLKSVGISFCILLASMFLTILPWTIRNWYVMKELVLIDVNPGINLYLAHNEKANGFWVNMGLEDPVIKLGGTPAADREGKKRAWEFIKANPGRTIRQAIKVHKLFWTMENDDIQRLGPEWLKELQKFYSFKILALFGIIGLIAALIIHWKTSLWLIVYMLAYNGLIDFLYWASRYRFAIEPFLVLFAGLTLAIIFKGAYKLMRKPFVKFYLKEIKYGQKT